MNILVIGSGGREHALAWKCAQSSLVDTVFVAPGNAGTTAETGVSNVAIGVDDTQALLQFAVDNSIGLTIVGPEVPLVLGIVDRFKDAGLKIFGPAKAAAQLEGSKAFAKDFLARHRIPTAAYQSFTDTEAAIAHIRDTGAPIVIKADGLAAGKGVVVAQTTEEAEQAVHNMLSGQQFGEAGNKVVIEEFMRGEEASFICLVAGREVLPLASSQDHKARDNGDKGPNTGGMGAYSPAPVVTDEVHERIMKTVIQPTIDGLVDDGAPFCGFLYAGLMIENGEPRVVEFNVRLGDPETQPLLMRLDSDLVAACLAAVDGELNKHQLHWKPGSSVGVVMAAGGYPDFYASGNAISGLDAIANIANLKAFHAGTKAYGNDTLTAGGRVLCVVGLGEDVAAAQQLAYQGVEKINWQDAYYRTDIAYRALSARAGDLVDS